MTFTFRRDGKVVQAREGQSIAGALHAHGDRTLSRSLKFHRPRGIFCATGDCNGCLMRVDGIPNVKTCVTEAQPGMDVRGQNAFPNVRYDVFRVFDHVFHKEFDHHRAFIRPRFLYSLFGRVIRAFAGWGRLPDQHDTANHSRPEADESVGTETGKNRRTPSPNARHSARRPAGTRTEPPITHRPDVCVVGGGPAGMAAALSAAQEGSQVLLLERHHALGGNARLLAHPVPDPDEPERNTTASALCARWTERLAHYDQVTILTGTALGAAYRSGLLVGQATDRLHLIRPRALVVATGGLDAQASFPGNDLPGILSANAVHALITRERVQPGKRAVILGAGPHGLATASALVDAGVHVVAILEPGPKAPAPTALHATVAHAGIPILARTHVAAAYGHGRLRTISFQDAAGRRARIDSDLLVIALGRKTSPEPFQAIGAKLRYLPKAGGAVPLVDEALMTSAPGVFACGDAAGIADIEAARDTGRRAGAAAARYAKRHDDARPPRTQTAFTTSTRPPAGAATLLQDPVSDDVTEAAA